MTTHRDLTTPELRPCPFCGGQPQIAIGHRSRIDAKVCCLDCSAEGAVFGTDDYKTETDYAAQAIAAWNRRPRTFTAAEVAEAMRGWGDAYAAFVGAFDTPAARRKQSDEYANDARDRLRDFHERITHWLRENEG
jgi:Lar family restriction alleviation protein